MVGDFLGKRDGSQSLDATSRPDIVVHRRHPDYASYVATQKEKTTDPARIEKWLGEEWNVKLDGFRLLFERNHSFVKHAGNAICLGARTGQEVVALREIGIEAIGIDLVPFPPHTIEGDVHDTGFEDASFDLVFTNIVDHTPYPQRLADEIERLLASGGHAILNLQIGVPGDRYSENVINNPRAVEDLFSVASVIESREITNSFDGMNWELVLQQP